MLNTLLFFCAVAAVSPELDARVAVLRHQLERLQAINVDPKVQHEKETKLSGIETAIAGGVTSGSQVNDIYQDLDQTRTWLLANAQDRPQLPQGECWEESTRWVVQNGQLKVELDRRTLALTVHTPQETWSTAASNLKDLELVDGKTFSLTQAQTQRVDIFNTGFSVGFCLSLSGFAVEPELELNIMMHLAGAELEVEIVASKEADNLAFLNWPKPWQTGNSSTDLSVIPNMQGILLPGDWPQELHRRDLVNTRALYMPWWGEIHQGHGAQTILETSDDAGAAYDHPIGGPTRIQPIWYASLGKLRYPRLLRYVFDDQATYVTMAKRYRRCVQETGRFVSLDEKRARTPALNRVIGSPAVLIGALSHNVLGARFHNYVQMEQNHRVQTFAEQIPALRQLKSKGIETAYVHLDGWGFAGYDNRHPDVIPPGPEQGGWEGLKELADTCQELGYVFALHDQYRDYYLNAASFNDQLTIHRRDGTREEHAEWPGGRQTYLSPRFAPGYVRRNHDAFKEHNIQIGGAYLDVFAVVPLEESFQPLHPVTRTDCAQYRRECFDLLRARGYIVSSEEPADFLMRSVELFHHGPYPTFPKGYGPGGAMGIPVPLLNLVYHDSVLLPWYLSENGGWGIPDGDAGWLHCLLNAGMPYASPGGNAEHIALVKRAAELNKHLAALEMTNHEFLDPSRRIQRTTFSDGTQVTVDFTKKTCTVQ